MFFKSLCLLALVSAAVANPFVTAPTASTTYSGGKAGAVVQWQDDGKAPSLKDFGPSKISIYVGNAQQQTSLQLINGTVDVSLVNEISFTPDATIGPNGNQYFIRIESNSFKDPTQPQFPALSFSAKFTLDSMTGTFSPAIQSQISGQSTAPLSPSSTTSTSASTSTTKAAITTSASTTTSTAKPTTTSNSAGPNVKLGWAGVALGALVGVTMF